jgi:hypothetical protein
MHNSMQFVLANPTDGQEVEFNDWYAGPHMEHAMETPGIFGGQRFHRRTGPWPAGKHEYLTIWELDDPAATLEALAKVKFTDAMPISSAINMDTVQPPTMWHRASVRNSAHTPTDANARSTIVLVLANALPGEDEQFERAVMVESLAALADRPGVLAAHFFTLGEEQIRGNARKYRFGLLIELWDEDALGALAPLLPALPHLNPDSWFAPVFSSLAPRTTPATFAADQAASS